MGMKGKKIRQVVVNSYSYMPTMALQHFMLASVYCHQIFLCRCNIPKINPMQDKLTFHLVIHGHVQGVFFRDSMRREAQLLDVSGWVRNRSDGTVEAVVHGESAAVDAVVRWAHHGPPQAHVTQVDIAPTEGIFTGFKVMGQS